MFFERCEKISIDGTLYELTNLAFVELFNMKGKLWEIWRDFLDPSNYDAVTFDTYIQWKKNFIRELKEWDRAYTKHIKTIHVEMYAIHQQCMKPLLDLLDAN